MRPRRVTAICTSGRPLAITVRSGRAMGGGGSEPEPSPRVAARTIRSRPRKRRSSSCCSTCRHASRQSTSRRRLRARSSRGRDRGGRPLTVDVVRHLAAESQLASRDLGLGKASGPPLVSRPVVKQSQAWHNAAMQRARTQLLITFLVGCATPPAPPPTVPAAQTKTTSASALPVSRALGLRCARFRAGGVAGALPPRRLSTTLRSSRAAPACGFRSGRRAVSTCSISRPPPSIALWIRTVQREFKGRTRTIGSERRRNRRWTRIHRQPRYNESAPLTRNRSSSARAPHSRRRRDGVAYISTAKEGCRYHPRTDRSIVVLTSTTPLLRKWRTSIHFDGAPEGYAVDPTRGLFTPTSKTRTERSSSTSPGTRRLQCGMSPAVRRGRAVWP